MLTRTGDLAQSAYATQLLLEAQTRSRGTQIQISTGKVATQFSVIADSANRLVSAKDALQRIQLAGHNVGDPATTIETYVYLAPDMSAQ